MPTYHKDMPDYCPTDGANPIESEVFRAIRKRFPVEKDFLSHAERPRSRCDRRKCNSWGLSVWLSEDDMLFARNAQSFLREMYIAIGRVSKAEGTMLHTPSNDQPEHYTFWRDINVNFVPRFTVILPPEGEEL